MSKPYLVVGPEASGTGVGPSVCGAVGWSSQAVRRCAETVGPAVCWETQEQLLRWGPQRPPVSH